MGAVNVQQSTHQLQVLWVRDSYRRMGVARQLLKIATTKHGCTQLSVDKSNTAAISYILAMVGKQQKKKTLWYIWRNR